MHKNKDFGFTLFFTYNIHFVTQNGSSTFSTNLAFAKVTTSHPSPPPTLPNSSLRGNIQDFQGIRRTQVQTSAFLSVR